MINFDNINIKKLLQKLSIKPSEFSYSAEYMDGFYMTVSDFELTYQNNFNIGFGSKSKNTKIAFIEIREPKSNTYLEEINSPYMVGEAVRDLESFSLKAGYYTKSIGDYTIKIILENQTIVEILIHRKSIVEQNSQFHHIHKKLDKIIEPDNSFQYRQAIKGEWIKSEQLSNEYNKTVAQKTQCKYSQEFTFYQFTEEHISSCIQRHKIENRLNCDTKIIELKPIKGNENTNFIFLEEKIKRSPYKISKVYKNGYFTVEFVMYKRHEKIKLKIENGKLLLQSNGYFIVYTPAQIHRTDAIKENV